MRSHISIRGCLRPNICWSVCRSVRRSVRPSVGHTRVEFLRNGPNSNKIASGIRKYAILKTIQRQVLRQFARERICCPNSVRLVSLFLCFFFFFFFIFFFKYDRGNHSIPTEPLYLQSSPDVADEVVKGEAGIGRDRSGQRSVRRHPSVDQVTQR